MDSLTRVEIDLLIVKECYLAVIDFISRWSPLCFKTLSIPNSIFW